MNKKWQDPMKCSSKAFALSGALFLISYIGFAQMPGQHQAVDSAVAGKDQVFTSVDHPPEYPGGYVAQLTYLSQEIVYPASALRANIEGRVVAQFIVDKKGRIKDIKIVQSLQYDCDNEVIRVIGAMPRWKPGLQKGLPVNVYYTLPVSFRIR